MWWPANFTGRNLQESSHSTPNRVSWPCLAGVTCDCLRGQGEEADELDPLFYYSAVNFLPMVVLLVTESRNLAGTPERGKRRIAVSDAEARIHLRAALIARYRAERRYQAIVRQDLGPQWRRVLIAENWEDRRPIWFEEVLNALPAGPQATSLPVEAAVTDSYVQAVGAAVGRSMGVTTAGYPAPWMAAAVHNDVAGNQAVRDRLTVAVREADADLSLSLDVAPNFVGVRYFAEGGAATDGYDQDFDLSHIGLGYGPEHWAELERLAFGILREAIADMRRGIEARHPGRNPSTMDAWDRDLDALVRVLFHKDQPRSSADQTRLRRLANLLGVDIPGRHRSADASAMPLNLISDPTLQEPIP